jgi:hypothetical protein
MRPFLHFVRMAKILRKAIFIMANNASHNLVFKKVDGLIIIYLEEYICERIVVVQFSSQSLFL